MGATTLPEASWGWMADRGISTSTSSGMREASKPRSLAGRFFRAEWRLSLIDLSSSTGEAGTCWAESSASEKGEDRGLLGCMIWAWVWSLGAGNPTMAPVPGDPWLDWSLAGVLSSPSRPWQMAKGERIGEGLGLEPSLVPGRPGPPAAGLAGAAEGFRGVKGPGASPRERRSGTSPSWKGLVPPVAGAAEKGDGAAKGRREVLPSGGRVNQSPWRALPMGCSGTSPWKRLRNEKAMRGGTVSGGARLGSLWRVRPTDPLQ